MAMASLVVVPRLWNNVVVSRDSQDGVRSMRFPRSWGRNILTRKYGYRQVDVVWGFQKLDFVTRVMWRHAVFSLLVWSLAYVRDPIAVAVTTKSNCEDIASYYQGTQNLRGPPLSSKLHEIVQGHHSIPYVKVWDALKILDAADAQAPSSSADIIEIYSLKRVPKELAGKIDGWNREHVWPRSYGLQQSQPEFTDLHNLRPADTNVNSSRRNKYFGDCTIRKVGDCLVPANREAAPDTATDRKTWRPPSEVRGDIARAAMYMAVRYSPWLKLSDSPNAGMTRIKFLLVNVVVGAHCAGKAEMGLLSILLKWNELDPPSPTEQLRNYRVCALYQHNRNPFVDHPEFANEIWGGAKEARQESVLGSAASSISSILASKLIIGCFVICTSLAQVP